MSVQEIETDVEMHRLKPQQLEAVWPMVRPLMEEVAESYRGKQTVETLTSEILRGEVELWVVVEGNEILAIIGTQLCEEPSGMKTLFIKYADGRQMHKWLGMIDEFEAYARANGCEYVEMIARKGWTKRLKDYKMTHVLLEKRLD